MRKQEIQDIQEIQEREKGKGKKINRAREQNREGGRDGG